ncbi:recombinase family protein [Blastochloris sulfoviridis]|uniref:Recombinase family protein n=1 Tax=Blastochloris sulfoviridis TaxID=50712 RepID=A0A5M6HHP7_9HYPH|nr:recombinase family protein [Blastochloris sulfoviridis]KAA5595393.1 recombinase family protein [Blastochloris sulfoviridis]
MTTKRLRCAIYCRVSTDAGLDQAFNSLDAQFEASQAYIKSQAHEGWSLVRMRFADGGFSGGSTDRPALQQLLADIEAGRIDVVVVYKVDRLTRSLADFAKLVELFDRNSVSFVSVTQQFNTTTSMGRLTLNVLLSFAQFEREVTSERIRDKIAASKLKGLWVGGMVPLGYDCRDKTLVINPQEAETVRTIFRRYLEVGSIGALLRDLRQRGIVTKIRPLSTGRTIGGIPFARGSLTYLLHNRFYIGEVAFKGRICPGAQPAILDRDLFEAVQQRLADQHTGYRKTREASAALLMGRIFDDRGNRMTPSAARKRRRSYRYYVSAALLDGEPERAGAVARVPAESVERVVVDALRAHLGNSAPDADTDLIAVRLDRVVVGTSSLAVTLRATSTPEPNSDDAPSSPTTLTVPWTKAATRRHREILRPADATAPVPRPMRAETNAKLVTAIARSRRWLAEIEAGDVTINTIAEREHLSPRHVHMTISLAFLSPRLVEAAIDGRLPHGVGVSRLFDPPACWRRQHDMLGLAF